MRWPCWSPRTCLALLLLLQVGGCLALDRLGLLLVCWLPGAVLGNTLGLAYGLRLPADVFRTVTLGLVAVTGVATVLTTLA